MSFKLRGRVLCERLFRRLSNSPSQTERWLKILSKPETEVSATEKEELDKLHQLFQNQNNLETVIKEEIEGFFLDEIPVPPLTPRSQFNKMIDEINDPSFKEGTQKNLADLESFFAMFNNSLPTKENFTLLDFEPWRKLMPNPEAVDQIEEAYRESLKSMPSIQMNKILLDFIKELETKTADLHQIEQDLSKSIDSVKESLKKAKDQQANLDKLKIDDLLNQHPDWREEIEEAILASRWDYDETIDADSKSQSLKEQAIKDFKEVAPHIPLPK